MSKVLILFPDGKAWHYAEAVIRTKDAETYTEVLFTDVTELYDKGVELKVQAKRLHQLAIDIKQLSDNALVIARENEVLTAKTRLHDQMGAGLTAVRQFLLHNAGEDEAVSALRLLRRAISMIKDDNNEASHSSEWSELVHDADSIGIKIKLNIGTQEQEEMNPVLILAMRECLTNAARHADATALQCTVRESNGSTVLLVINDGIPPKDDVPPKGGRRNLLRIVNNCGGSMSIQSKPFFELTVTVPSERY